MIHPSGRSSPFKGKGKLHNSDISFSYSINSYFYSQVKYPWYFSSRRTRQRNISLQNQSHPFRYRSVDFLRPMVSMKKQGLRLKLFHYDFLYCFSVDLCLETALKGNQHLFIKQAVVAAECKRIKFISFNLKHKCIYNYI